MQLKITHLVNYTMSTDLKLYHLYSKYTGEQQRYFNTNLYLERLTAQDNSIIASVRYHTGMVQYWDGTVLGWYSTGLVPYQTTEPHCHCAVRCRCMLWQPASTTPKYFNSTPADITTQPQQPDSLASYTRARKH